MIDAQAVDEAPAHPVEHPRVGVGKHPLVLDTQPDQRVDVEEAAVVDLAAGQPPPGQAVVLARQQPVEPVGIAVDLGHLAVDRRGDLGALAGQARQQAGQHLLVAMPASEAGDCVAVVRGGLGQGSQGAGEEGQLGRAAAGRDRPQRLVERARRHRHAVLAVAHLEAAAVAAEAQLAGFEHAAEVIAEDRQQHHVAPPLLARLPVDVEIGGVAARRTVLEHVPPPAVGGPGDGHVIGDDVEDLAQALAGQRLAQSRVPRLAAELGADPRRIDHVVAVGAARRGLQVGRAVEVRDAERREIVRDRRRRVEIELGAQLHAVGGEDLARHAAETDASGAPEPGRPIPRASIPEVKTGEMGPASRPA